MGNANFNPCPFESTMEKEYKSEIILATIHKNDRKHSLQIEGPSEIYKKSLRKDLDTAELA